jgi:hypothetical protein
LFNRFQVANWIGINLFASSLELCKVQILKLNRPLGSPDKKGMQKMCPVRFLSKFTNTLVSFEELRGEQRILTPVGQKSRPSGGGGVISPLGLVSHLSVGTVVAEDLAAVPAVVLPVRQRERGRAGGALVHLGVVRPLPAALPRQLDLANICKKSYKFVKNGFYQIFANICKPISQVFLKNGQK